MLKEILAITGKPGLYKIVTHTGKSLIVEDIVSKKRIPVSARERVVSLGDIAMYTEEGEKPLGEILDEIYTSQNGSPIDVKSLITNGELKATFEKYVPEYDRERVHDSDVKKLFSWYNILSQNGFTKFSEEENKDEETSDDKEKE